MKNRSKKSRRILFLTLFFISIFSLVNINLWGIEFDGLTLSNDDRLLYKTNFDSQNALFITNLNNMSTQQLTAAAQKMYLVSQGRSIIAVSRFGAARIPVSGGLPSILPGYPSFALGSVPLRGRTQDIAPSPDGRWVAHIEPVTPGYGNLLIVDTSSGVKRVISERIELPGADFPVKWSPDSRLLVYEKGGRLFYFPILNEISVLVDERFRMIGTGGINSVLWGNHGDFYYYTGNTVYRVINPELFTRTIYGDFLSIGRVAAVLPFEFDSGFDRFWVSPDSRHILINKNGRGLFFFLLGDDRINPAAVNANVLPYVLIPFGAENFYALWPAAGSQAGNTFLTVIYSIPAVTQAGAQSAATQSFTTALRFEISGNNVIPAAVRQNPSSPNAAISPDGTRAVFWGRNGLELWDYTNWRLIQQITREEIFSCAFVNNRNIIISNQNFIEEINITSSAYQRRRICLSGADEFGFEESRDISRIIARKGSDWFASDGTSAWAPVNGVQLRRASFASDRFRVFLEQQGPSGHFRNIPMIRSMQATGTLSLVARHTSNNAFTPGRPSQIALCFDLYDDDTGLQQVLAALRRHNIRATFFLNGEFIRRNPLGALAIVNAGHETASLFYSPIDLSDTRYRITNDFITRGLARNEDEFHRATGRELSILWHPPFYRSNAAVNAAASAAGYFTVERDIDPGDYISREDALRLNLHQTPPAQIIEQIIQRRQPGAVVPIRLGLLPGGRDEYLFQRIDVLLDALFRSGYTVVPVSSVIR